MSKRQPTKRPGAESRVDVPPGLDRMLRDLERALAEVGSTPQQRAKWLVETFLPADPRDLSTGEHIWREHQARAFVIQATADPAASLRRTRVSAGTGGTFGDAALRKVWLDVRDRVTRWAKGEEVDLPKTSSVAIRRQKTGKDLRAEIHRTGEGADAFVLAVFDLFSHPTVRVRKCDHCGDFFVPIRRQERHPACARLHHDQVWNTKRSKTKGEGTNG